MPHPMPALMVATAKAIDLMMGYPLRHSVRVALLAMKLAEQLGWCRSRERADLLWAALWLDLGWVSSAHTLISILPSKTSEKAYLKMHGVAGMTSLREPLELLLQGRMLPPELSYLLETPLAQTVALLGEFPVGVDGILPLIENHHEYCDGSGYPRGISGGAIPRGSRILTYCDHVITFLEALEGMASRQTFLSDWIGWQAPWNAFETRFDPQVHEAMAAMCSIEGDTIVLLKSMFSLEGEREVLGWLTQYRSVDLPGQTHQQVAAMGALVDAMVPGYTQGHSERVSTLAVQMGETLGVSPETLNELRWAGYLHDFGQVAVPLTLLVRPSTLMGTDRSTLHDHVHWGAQLLGAVPGFENIVRWVSEHHEWLNGRGYPLGRKEEEVSVGGRILAIAESFDAMTSKRPYRQAAYGVRDAMSLLRHEREGHLDEALLGVAQKVLLG